jgi:8-oxo-dGTP diphosphatase
VRRDGEVALVHRPRYDDWSFPKGKVHRGETFGEAARREVLEETGLRCRSGTELPSAHYPDARGRPKIVRYWVMWAEGDPSAFSPTDEVDEVRWLGIEEARARLSYEHDRVLLDELEGGE